MTSIFRLIIATVCCFSVAAVPLSCEDHSRSPRRLIARDEPQELAENATKGSFVAFYADSLGQTVYKYVPGANVPEEEKSATTDEFDDLQAPENITLSPSDSLDKFVYGLKSFYSGLCFEYEKLESVGDRLEKDLAQIATTVTNHSQEHPELKAKLSFAQHMFHVMVDSIELLRHYTFLGRADLHLVNRIIDFNLRLLAMYNSKGVPGQRAEGYVDAVIRYTIMLKFWEDEFGILENVPIGVRYMFQQQQTRARGMLDELREHIPTD